MDKNIRFFVVGAIALLWPFFSHAAQFRDTLQINRGAFQTVKKTSFPALAYNRGTDYQPTNPVFQVRIGDTIHFYLKNNDTAIHGFTIKGGSTSVTLPPSGIDSVTFIPLEEGLFLYFDPINYPMNRYMGLGGMIVVTNASAKSFYWNLKEHEVNFSRDIAQGTAVDWSTYDPDYFTINGLSFPDLQLDTVSNVRAHIGDTILICIANTGQSLHSIHFHGFHCRVRASNASNILKDWVKDTFPIRSMDALLLELVPDKVGRYSVHDHNLVAITGGGTHPNGMFTIMTIQ